MTQPGRPSPRVMEHVDRLRAAGLDTQAFFDALIAIRDDSALPAAHREALYKLIAMECFIWYLEAIRGEPVDRMKAAAEAMKVLEQNDVAIKKKTPGANAAELLTKDISQKPPPADPPASAKPTPPKKK